MKSPPLAIVLFACATNAPPRGLAPAPGSGAATGSGGAPPTASPVLPPRDPAPPTEDAMGSSQPAEPQAAPGSADAAPASASRVDPEIAFQVRSAVGAAPPVLRVVVRNPGPDPIPLVRFHDGACFAAHYLAIELTRPDGKPAKRRACTRKAARAEERVAAGVESTIDVPLASVFDGWPRGIYEIEVAWDAGPLEQAGLGVRVDAAGSSQDETRFAIARPLATVRVARGKSARLPGGAVLTFRGHGHKHVMAGGPPSPLIIHGELAVGGSAGSEFSVSVALDARRWFPIEGHVFELVDHAYDTWMTLRYYGSLAL